MNQNVFFFLKYKKDTRYLYDNLSVLQGLKLLRQHGFTATPVIDAQGYYIGTIREGDFLYYLIDHPCVSEDDLENLEIRELIDPHYNPAVSMDVDMETLFDQSLKQNFVPVVDDRHIFIGIVTRQAIIEYLLKEAETYEDILPISSLENE